jgi:hypothetical protein
MMDFTLLGFARIPFPDGNSGAGVDVGGRLPLQEEGNWAGPGDLLRSELVIERAEVVSQALRKFSASPADFADCLIERCGHADECQYTYTFDRNAAAAGMTLLG